MANCTAKGFRLPTSTEWEYAARYRGTDSTNAVLSNGIYYTKGNSASGDTKAYDVPPSSVGTYAVYNVNSGSSTAAVKNKAVNTLGLYDMSGNVVEWIFEWQTAGTYRMVRGGSWTDSAEAMQLGIISGDRPYSGNGGIGFRFVRTQ